MSAQPKDVKFSPDEVACYTRQLAEMRPDNLDVIHMANDAIDEVCASQLAAEDRGDIPRTDYGRLSLDQIREGHQCAERR